MNKICEKEVFTMANGKSADKSKKSKLIWIIVLVAAIVVALCCIAYFVFLLSGQRMTENERNEYTITAAPTSNAQNTSETAPKIDIDFAKLKKVNPEVTAWLRVDGTDIDYPVMYPKGTGDSYYLYHTYKYEYSSAGAIYFERQNSPDFSDPVTVLYGHNWRTNGYFRPLYNFKNYDFFEKNKYMYILTPERKLTYEIYAAYRYDNRHILNSFDFSQESVLENYLQMTLNPDTISKNIRSGVTLNADSKILTLSTCWEGDKNSRYLVQGVLVSDEPVANEDLTLKSTKANE